MVRGEAVTVALFGTVGGVGLGLFLGWAMVEALADEGFTDFAVPVDLAGRGPRGRRPGRCPGRRAPRPPGRPPRRVGGDRDGLICRSTRRRGSVPGPPPARDHRRRVRHPAPSLPLLPEGQWRARRRRAERRWLPAPAASAAGTAADRAAAEPAAEPSTAAAGRRSGGGARPSRRAGRAPCRRSARPRPAGRSSRRSRPGSTGRSRRPPPPTPCTRANTPRLAASSAW